MITSMFTCECANLGCPGDYNQWEQLGNKGWGYNDLEPYFVKSEKTHSPKVGSMKQNLSPIDKLWALSYH